MRDTSTIWTPLAEIRLGDRSARSLSSATVERYRQWLEQGRDAPPVRLARLDDGFVVRDGRHRVAAALAAGHTVIEAEVRPIGRIRAWITAIARRAHRLAPGDALWRVPLACTEQGVGSIPTVSIPGD